MYVVVSVVCMSVFLHVVIDFFMSVFLQVSLFSLLFYFVRSSVSYSCIVCVSGVLFWFVHYFFISFSSLRVFCFYLCSSSFLYVSMQFVIYFVRYVLISLVCDFVIHVVMYFVMCVFF